MPFFPIPKFCDHCGTPHYYLTELLDGKFICDLCFSYIMSEESHE